MANNKDKEQAAQNERAQPERPMRLDQTVPGGCYRVNGRLVNANGEPLPDLAPDASSAPAQQQQQNGG